VKRSSLVLPAATALLAAAALTVSAAAQAPAAPGGRNFPPPTNLKVLPKDLTGAQVREIMRGWSGALGVECDTCHAADPKNVGPNGRPRLDFASDAKDEKVMARIMYTMLEVDKKDYVAKVAAIDKMDEPAAPLTCGTCHRGHLDPEKFTPPPEHPKGAPGAMPGMQH
jgi:cytochrome c553